MINFSFLTSFSFVFRHKKNSNNIDGIVAFTSYRSILLKRFKNKENNNFSYLFSSPPQVHPKKYQKDTQRILGRILNHDDSINDRSPGSKLMTSDSSTRRLWAKTFGEHFSRNGAMFRGDPPACVIEPIPAEFKKTALGSAFQLHVRKVRERENGRGRRRNERAKKGRMGWDE